MSHVDFCLEIAEAITSRHNQHATLMITAPTGKGKSYAGGAIGERVAQYVAEIKGGSPEDYFNPDHIAVITQNEVLRVMSTHMDKKYCTVGFDDIGLAWNARDFMSEFNKCMNDIAQTIRTRNLFAYFTLPDPMLIDKVPRDLIKYEMTVESSHFDLGYVVAKIQEPMKKVQWGKKIRPYLVDLDNHRVVRHIIFRPSKQWIEGYEPRRQQIEFANTNNTVEVMQHIVQEEQTPQEPHSSKRSILSQAVKIDYKNGIVVDGKLIQNPSMEALADKYGVSKSTIHQALLFQQEQKEAPKQIPDTTEPKKI